MGKVYATDINNYYTKLNNIRKKFGLSTKTFPSASSGNSAKATEINAVDTELTQTVTDVKNTKYRGQISKSSSYSVSSGVLILETLNNNISTLLSTWSAACTKCSSDYSYDGDCSYNVSDNDIVCTVESSYEPSYASEGCPDYNYNKSLA